jgi:flagellar biosynthesis component FlhA
MKLDSRAGLISFAISVIATTILGIALVWASLASVSQLPGNQAGIGGNFVSPIASLLIISLVFGAVSSGIVLTKVYVDQRQNRRLQATIAEREHMWISHRILQSLHRVPSRNENGSALE